MRKFVVIVVLDILVAAVALIFVYAMIGVYGGLADVQESDKTFNCWVMGNGHCGPGAPFHGFVNLFNTDSE